MNKSIVIFLILTTGWYLFYVPEDSWAHILPIVSMGERSWPLYFFLLDALAIGLILFLFIQVIKLFIKKSKFIFVWAGFMILLIWPVLTVFATYNDLTQRLCRSSDTLGNCKTVLPGPNIKTLQLRYEK